MEQEDLLRKNELGIEKQLKMERERHVKQGRFYEDVGVTVEVYEQNLDINKINSKNTKNTKKKDKSIHHMMELNEDKNFIVNEEQIDDWNYYGITGDLLMEDIKVIKPTFLKSSLYEHPQITVIKKEKIVNYGKFKENLLLENLYNDHSLIESKKKLNEADEQRKAEETKKIKEEEEEEDRETKKLEEEKEKQAKFEEERKKQIEERNFKGIQKIKLEIQKNRSLVDKYAPKIDTDKASKNRKYENMSNMNLKLNINVEGVDQITKQDPMYLKNDLPEHPNNIISNSVIIQQKTFQQTAKATFVETTKVMSNEFIKSKQNKDKSKEYLHLWNEDK